MKLEDFPQNSRLILEQYLLPSTDGNASLSSLSLNLYMQVSRILCFNRVQVRTKTNKNDFPMLYGILFSGSGTYKDAPQLHLSDLTKRVTKDQELIKENRYNKLYAILVKRSEEEDGKVAQREYRKTHAIRKFKEVFSGGTYQGLQSERSASQSFQIGSIHFKHSEIIDALKGKDSNTYSLLYKIKEITLQGSSYSDTIKSEFDTKHVDGVPQTMFVHGSIDELYKTKDLLQSVVGLLSTGFARRTFILFSKKTERKILTPEDEQKNIDLMESSRNTIQDIFFNTHDQTFPNTIPDPDNELLDTYFYKTIDIKPETRELIKAYKDNNYAKANKLTDEKERADLYDRDNKAVRLASCIASLEHPEQLTITLDDFDLAIKLCDEWGNEFMSFLHNREDSLPEMMYKTLKSTSDKVSKTELRFLLPSIQRNSTGILNSCLDQLKELCAENNEILMTETRRGISEYYWIESEPKHEALSITPVVHLSVGNSNNPTETHFETKELPFDQIHEIIKGDKAYSASTFVNNQRLAANWAGKDDLLLFDIDNDEGELTTQQVKDLFKDFKFALFATRNHLKDKKDHGVKQRFRIIFPTTPLENISKEQYAKLKESIAKEFKIDKFCDMPASKDCARLFFAHNGQHFYSEGTKILNWKCFDHTVQPKKLYKPTSTHSPVDKQNTRTDQRFVTKQGNPASWDYFNFLKPGDTEPVYCTDHEDKHPSAFISRNMNESQNLFFKCSGCNTLYFSK